MKKIFKVLLVSLCIFSALAPAVGAQPVEVSSIIASENINPDFSTPKAISPELSEEIKRATIATPIESNGLFSAQAALMSYNIVSLSSYASITSNNSFKTTSGSATLTLVQWGLGGVGGGAQVYYYVSDANGNSVSGNSSSLVKGDYTNTNTTVGFSGLPKNTPLYINIVNWNEYSIAGNGYVQ